MDGDILVPIPDEDLPKLAEIYEKHKEWAPNAYSIILTGIEWKQKGYSTFIFLSPNNSWKEDGTFFVFIENASFEIYIFTLDESCKNVYEGLTKTKHNLKRPIDFYAIHYNYLSRVYAAVYDLKLNLYRAVPCLMYSIPKEQALKFEYTIPPEAYLKVLDKSCAIKINSIWPHQFPNSEKYLSTFIEMNTGFGLFLKSNDELVSWILMNPMGQMSQLQTVDEHKRKGYGSLMTKILAKEIAKRGYNPFGTVLVMNYASRGMFEKAGFRSIGNCTFLHTIPNE